MPKLKKKKRNLKTKRKPNKVLEIVEWEDAADYSGWYTKDEILEIIEKKQYPCITIGYVCYEDDKWLMLANSIEDSPHPIHGGLHTIPIKNILSRRSINIK